MVGRNLTPLSVVNNQLEDLSKIKLSWFGWVAKSAVKLKVLLVNLFTAASLTAGYYQTLLLASEEVKLGICFE